MRTRLILAITLAALAAVRVSAHDFWLAAVNWVPGDGAPMALTAGLGERFPARTTFRPNGKWLAEWRLIGADGEVPAGEFRLGALAMQAEIPVPAAGAFMGVARVNAQLTEMTGEAFTEYLKEERLQHIIAFREVFGESGLIATERFYRFAKVAVRNGSGPGAHLTRPAGLLAEFVPEADPTSIRPGAPLTVQLLVNGSPVANAPVSAVSDSAVVDAHTDGEGRATFAIDRPGAWMIRTVYMVRLPPEDHAEWESYWATLVFHTAAR